MTPVSTNLQLPETRTINVVANTALNVTLTRGAMLQGTVTNGGNPYQDMRVEIAGVTGASAVTDAAGAYAFLAPAGTHVLQLTAEAGALRGIALAPQTGVVVALPGPVTQDIALTRQDRHQQCQHDQVTYQHLQWCFVPPEITKAPAILDRDTGYYHHKHQ